MASTQAHHSPAARDGGLIPHLVRDFNLSWYIMGLGTGGTAIAGYAFLNYTLPRPEGLTGLLHFGNMGPLAAEMGPLYEMFYQYLKFHIPFFSLFHLIVMAAVSVLFVMWRVQYPDKFHKIADDPNATSMTIAPVLAFGMTFNVLLVPSFAMSEWVRANFQNLMIYGFALWFVIWLFGMITAMRSQRAYFNSGDSPAEAHFGWMLIPFALSMIAVSGAAIAAMAQDPTLSRVTFFLTLVPFTMAVFLVMINLVLIFQAHYKGGLPTIEKLPTFFIVVPITTLISVTLFRYAHFFEKQFDAHVSPMFFVIVLAGGWAFQMWYAGIGLFMTIDYFKNYMFGRYFHESQWGFICPMVAAAVLGSFVYQNFLPSPVILFILAGLIIGDVMVLAFFYTKQVQKLFDPSISVPDVVAPAAA